MTDLRAALKAEFDAAGLLEYHPIKVYAKFAVLLAATIALFAMFFVADSWWLKAPLFVFASSANVAIIMLGHDSGHGAVSKNKFVNDLLGYLMFPLLGGLSLPYWKYKHNTLHHSYPNVDKKDPDLDVWPFAFHSANRKDDWGFRGTIQRIQGLAFWPLTLFTSAAMRYDSIKFSLTDARRLVPAQDRALDAVCLAGHYFLWLVAPIALGLPLVPVLVFYAAWSALVGLLLAAIFMPAHMTLPLYVGYDDNFVLQLRTTQNLKTNALFSYLLIGLDYQVEHHMFHRMSHLNTKRAAPVLKAFCEKHGLPYQEQGWGRALWDVTRRVDQLPHYQLIQRPD